MEMETSATYFQGVVHIGAGISYTRVHDLGQGIVGGNLVAHTDRSRRRRRGVVVDCYWIVQWDITRDSRVVSHVVLHRRTPCPDDDGVGVGVARGDSMGEVQAGGILRSSTSIAFVDFVDGHTQARMIVGGASVIDVGRIACQSNACEGKNGQEGKHGER